MEPLIKHQSPQILGGRISGAHRHLQMERGYVYSVSGGAGGRGTRISTGNYDNRFGSLGAGYEFGDLAIGKEKQTMQHLNDRLASYLDTVKDLEKANSKLEIKIRECIENKGPMARKDFSKYNAIITDLSVKILEMLKGNSHLAISLDNARLASDDFRVKMEYETSMRQMVESDAARLRKLLDEINVIRLHLETDIESLNEELIIMRKNHKTEVAELRTEITQVGVHVDVDAPKGQDLARIMEEMRAKYEKIALKNREEVKAWHESQITEVQVQVTQSTTALKDATGVLTESRKRCQAFDIELQSALNMKASLEAALRDTDMRYNMEVEKYNMVILRLQEELTRIRGDIQHKTREYDHLLNIKVKLEAEIMEYRRLLDGGEQFRLEDAVDSKLIQTKVVTVTQTLVDGKVVSESKDIKSSEEVAVQKL